MSQTQDQRWGNQGTGDGRLDHSQEDALDNDIVVRPRPIATNRNEKGRRQCYLNEVHDVEGGMEAYINRLRVNEKGGRHCYLNEVHDVEGDMDDYNIGLRENTMQYPAPNYEQDYWTEIRGCEDEMRGRDKMGRRSQTEDLLSLVQTGKSRPKTAVQPRRTSGRKAKSKGRAVQKGNGKQAGESDNTAEEESARAEDAGSRLRVAWNSGPWLSAAANMGGQMAPGL